VTVGELIAKLQRYRPECKVASINGEVIVRVHFGRIIQRDASGDNFGRGSAIDRIDLPKDFDALDEQTVPLPDEQGKPAH
jgi:hypothetical protein